MIELANKGTSFNNLSSKLQQGKPCRTILSDGRDVDYK